MAKFIVFSENSVNGVEFCRNVIGSEGHAFLWCYENPLESKIYDDFNGSFVLGADFKSGEMVVKLYDAVRENLFEPDYVVFRGSVEECGCFSALIKTGVVKVPCFSVVSGFSVPLGEDDFEVLDSFDKNYLIIEKEEQECFLNILSEMDCGEMGGKIKGIAFNSMMNLVDKKNNGFEEIIKDIVEYQANKKESVSGCEV